MGGDGFPRTTAGAGLLTDGAGTSPTNGVDLELDGASTEAGEVPFTGGIDGALTVSDMDKTPSGRRISGVVGGVMCGVGCFRAS